MKTQKMTREELSRYKYIMEGSHYVELYMSAVLIAQSFTSPLYQEKENMDAKQILGVMELTLDLEKHIIAESLSLEMSNLDTWPLHNSPRAPLPKKARRAATTGRDSDER